MPVDLHPVLAMVRQEAVTVLVVDRVHVEVRAHGAGVLHVAPGLGPDVRGHDVGSRRPAGLEVEQDAAVVPRQLRQVRQHEVAAGGIRSRRRQVAVAGVLDDVQRLLVDPGQPERRARGDLHLDAQDALLGPGRIEAVLHPVRLVVVGPEQEPPEGIVALGIEQPGRSPAAEAAANHPVAGRGVHAPVRRHAQQRQGVGGARPVVVRRGRADAGEARQPQGARVHEVSPTRPQRELSVSPYVPGHAQSRLQLGQRRDLGADVVVEAHAVLAQPELQGQIVVRAPGVLQVHGRQPAGGRGRRIHRPHHPPVWTAPQVVVEASPGQVALPDVADVAVVDAEPEFVVAGVVAAEPGHARRNLVTVPLGTEHAGGVHRRRVAETDVDVAARVEVPAHRQGVRLAAGPGQGEPPLEARSGKPQQVRAQDLRLPVHAAGRLGAGEGAGVRVEQPGPVADMTPHELPALARLPGELAQDVLPVEVARGRRSRRRVLRPDSAQPGEEPEPVVPDRTAQGERGFRVLEDVLVPVEVLAVRVEVRVPVANVEGPGDVVAARLGNHVDHSAGRPPVAGLEAPRLEVDLLDRVEVQMHADRRPNGIGGVDVVDVVDVLALGRPEDAGVGRDRRDPAVRPPPRPRRRDSGRLGQHVVVPPVDRADRRFLEMLVGEGLRGRDLLRVDDRRLGDDRDLLRELAQLEVDVEFRHPVQPDLDLVAPLRNEAVELDVDGVDAGRQTVEVDAATGVAELDAGAHQRRRGHGDHGAGKRRVVLVLDVSGEPARRLGERRSGGREKRDEPEGAAEIPGTAGRRHR